MTDEEYLRACGDWVLWSENGVVTEAGRTGEDAVDYMPLAKAVETQLAEDRARLAFVLHRTPQPEARSCDPGFFAGVPWQTGYAWDKAPSNAAAAAVEALKMQRPVVAVNVAEEAPLFIADRVGFNVAASRNGVLTVRLDDGREHQIAVVAGDTVKMIGEAVEATLRSAYGVKR